MWKLLFLLALLALPALPAHASTIYNLDIISSSSIGSGILGTVTLTQNGANEVDIAIKLADDTAFVNTGGPHHAFAYNLNLATPYVITVTSPLNIFSPVTGITNTPYGAFTNGFDCTGCGNGGSNPNSGPLLFMITDTSGISVDNFVSNTVGSAHYFFSADVIGPAGSTGNIASDRADPPSVPLPGSWIALASALLMLGFLRFRQSGKSI